MDKIFRQYAVDCGAELVIMDLSATPMEKQARVLGKAIAEAIMPLIIK
jgi:hypothetical protein